MPMAVLGTDNVDVTVNALPTVSAGADQAVCDGGAVTLSGSGAIASVWDNGNNTNYITNCNCNLHSYWNRC